MSLWVCPKCGRGFANRNQSHTCAPLGEIARHFDGTDPNVRATFDRLIDMVSELGPVTVLPEKTRIALQVRMSFAALMPKRKWLDGHVVLARRVESPRFRRIDTYSPQNIVHAFRLVSPDDVDEEVRSWFAGAYSVGEQRHIRNRN